MTISARLHRIIFGHAHFSLCARAWLYRDTSKFWAGWVYVFGEYHCWQSFKYYRDMSLNE